MSSSLRKAEIFSLGTVKHPGMGSVRGENWERRIDEIQFIGNHKVDKKWQKSGAAFEETPHPGTLTSVCVCACSTLNIPLPEKEVDELEEVQRKSVQIVELWEGFHRQGNL